MFCSQCGSSLGPASSACSVCGKATGIASPRLAVPAVPPTQLTRPFQVHISSVRISYAGFWLRFVAWAIDEAMLAGIAFILLGRLVSLARVSNIFTKDLEPLDDMDDWYAVLGLAATLLFFLFFILASWLYHALMESSAWQGTIGKRALGIVVTDMHGARVNFGRASGRFFGRLLSAMIPLGIGYLLAGFTSQKQALHDLISSCLVLRRSQ